MELKIREIKKVDMDIVIKMLQDISIFEPQINDRQEIFNEFIFQNNVLGFVYLLKNTIVGYGSLVFETKIRGGRVGHIEDIVVNIKMVKATVRARKKITYFVNDIFFSN